MYNNLSNEAQVCSGRSKEEEEVLNDTWVSVPVGSEDGFKASRKNQYEEILFKCEDDRYELDMVIEVNSSTIMALTPVIKQIQDSTPEQLKSFKLEDGLDILHLRAIERIYGEKGSLVLQGINKNPVVAVPIVFTLFPYFSFASFPPFSLPPFFSYLSSLLTASPTPTFHLFFPPFSFLSPPISLVHQRNGLFIFTFASPSYGKQFWIIASFFLLFLEIFVVRGETEK